MEKNIKLKTQTIKPYRTIAPPISEYESSQFKSFLDVYFKLKITPSALKRI